MIGQTGRLCRIERRKGRRLCGGGGREREKEKEGERERERKRERERERELKRKGVRSERMDIYLSEGTYLYLLYNFEYEYLSGQNRSGPTHYPLSLD